jgi:hypothetical protein
LIPAGAVVVRSYVNVTTAYNGVATITVGQTGNATLVQTALDNSPGSIGLYNVLERAAWGASPLAVLVTLGGAPSVGAATVGVEYFIPLS